MQKVYRLSKLNRCDKCGGAVNERAPVRECWACKHGPSRYKIIAIQVEGFEDIDYVVQDTVTGHRISDWFQSREAAEYWLVITGLQ